MRRSALPLLTVAALCVALACGGNGKSNGNTAAPLKDLHDPKLAATATVPSALPTPIAANSIATGAGGGSSSSPDTYVVKSGDTLGAIADQLKVSVDDLAKANGITDPAKIQVGQRLTVPKPGATVVTPAAAGASPAAGQPALATVGPAATAASGAATIPPTGGAPSGGGTPLAGAQSMPAGGGSPTAGGATEHSVKQGETACTIARANDISVAELAAANNQTKEQIASLKIGQLLKIPAKSGNRDC